MEIGLYKQKITVDTVLCIFSKRDKDPTLN